MMRAVCHAFDLWEDRDIPNRKCGKGERYLWLSETFSDLTLDIDIDSVKGWFLSNSDRRGMTSCLGHTGCEYVNVVGKNL